MATDNAEHYLGDLEAASKLIPPNEPYIMMNLMKFKPRGKYPASYKGPQPGSITGRESYMKYKDMFIERATEMGVEISIVFLGRAHTQLAAGPQEGESWDVVLLVTFPSWAAFKSVLEDDKYKQEIQPHRLAALQEFRSFAVTGLTQI